MEEQQTHGGSLGARVSAGLQAGTLAGTVMLLWIMTAAWVQGQSFWTIPNLLAYTFYGNRMYRPDFVWRTWSGLALHFFFALVLAVVFAAVLPERAKARTAVFVGIAYGLCLYTAAGVWFWDRFNPPMALYGRQSFVLAGYMLFGLALGAVPLFREASAGERLGQFSRQ